jgi:hypothetical protein
MKNAASTRNLTQTHTDITGNKKANERRRLGILSLI